MFWYGPRVFFNSGLEWVTQIKYLGIVLDNKLSFKKHIEHVVLKLKRVNGIIRAVSGILPTTTLKTLYYSLAYSHIILSIVVWGGASDNFCEYEQHYAFNIKS